MEINNLSKSIELINNSIILIAENLKNKGRKSIYSFVNDYSKNVDNLILEIQKNESINFEAGNFIIKSISNQEMIIILDLYFKNKEGKWINQKRNTQPMEMVDYLDDDSIEKILKSGQVEYDVEPPKP